MDLNEIINALFRFYVEYDGNKSTEYTYGFMDAVAVLRDLNDDPLRQKLQA